jgi:AcrR family transcriptional regulator
MPSNSLALFSEPLPYFSRWIAVSFRYDLSGIHRLKASRSATEIIGDLPTFELFCIRFFGPVRSSVRFLTKVALPALDNRLNFWCRAGTATRAKVSKRDLYALFASKQAMLVACIKTRSAKMQLPSGLPVPRSRKMLVSMLVAFATNLLIETSHPAVIAMFRLAISEADRSPEVARALEECREANRRTLTDLLVHAQSVGLLPSGDAAEMANRYLALLWGDLMLSLLLGVAPRHGREQIERHATEVTSAFLRLHPQ